MSEWTCPICNASWLASTIHERPCLCEWTELQRAAIRRLNHELDEAQAQRNHAVAGQLRAWAEADTMLALLREVEWEGQDGCCPVCGDEEHHPACRLKAVLEGRDG